MGAGDDLDRISRHKTPSYAESSDASAVLRNVGISARFEMTSIELNRDTTREIDIAGGAGVGSAAGIDSA